MVLALRITSASAPEKRRYVEIDNLAEALVWLQTRGARLKAIAEDDRQYAIVRRIGGQP
jgi:hypothetical protein